MACIVTRKCLKACYLGATKTETFSLINKWNQVLQTTSREFYKISGKWRKTHQTLQNYALKISTNLYGSLWFGIKDTGQPRWLHRPLQCWFLLLLQLKEVVHMFLFFWFRPPSSSTSRKSKMSLRLLISAFLGFWEVFSHSFQPTVTNGHLLTAPPFINNIYLYSLENILSKVFFFPQRYQNILNYCKMSIWVENQAKNVTHI